MTGPAALIIVTAIANVILAVGIGWLMAHTKDDE